MTSVTRQKTSDTSQPPTIYIIDGSPAKTGAFVCARNIARALAGQARVVLVLDDKSTIRDEETSDFAEVKRLPIRPLRRSFVSAALYLPCLLTSSMRLIKHMHRDSAHTLCINDFYLMQGAMCRLLGFKGNVITWVRISPTAFGRISKFWLWTGKHISDHVVAVSKHIETLLPKGTATTLLYDSVEVQHKSNIPENSQTQRTFVFVGNYIEGKGQDIALDAMCRVTREFPDARIEFYGGDMGLLKNRAYRQALEERSKALGIADKIYFGDFVSDASSVLIGKFASLNLSSSESFSMAVLEASACGLPVIATRSGGPQEIIDDGKTGYLIPLDDAQACASAMIDLCSNPRLAKKMGRAGKSKVITEFSQKKFRQRLIKLVGLPLIHKNL